MLTLSIENGQVGFDMVVKALNKMTGEGGVFAGMMDKISKTTQGRWNSFVESLEISLFKAGGAFMKGFRLDELLQDFRKWAEGIQNDEGGMQAFGSSLRKVFDSVFSVIQSLVRVVKTVYDWIVQISDAVYGWAIRNQDLLKTLLAIVSVTTAFRVAVFAATFAVGVFNSALALMKSLLGLNALLSVIAGIASLSLPAVAAVLGLATALGVLVKYGDELSSAFDGFGDSLIEGLNRVGDIAGQTWKGIIDAFKVGDLRLLFEIAFAGIKYGFMVLVASIQAEWYRFVNTAFTKEGVFGGMTTWLAKDLASAEAWIRTLNPWASDADVKKATKDYWDKIRELDEMRKVEKAAVDPRVKGEIERIMTEVPAKAKAELDRLTGMAGREALFLSRPFARTEFEIEAYTKDYETGQEARRKEAERLARLVALDKKFSNPLLDLDKVPKAEIKEYLAGVDEAEKRIKGPVLNRWEEVTKIFVADLKKANAELKRYEEGYAGRLRESLTPLMTEVMKFAPLLGTSLVAKGSVVGVDRVFNVQPDHYDISGASKTYAQNLQQKYMRGVGEETHKFDYFTQHMKMIEEARTGLTDSMYQIAEGGGIFGSIAKSLGRQRRALSDEEAEYGMLEEFDKLRKYVGDRTTTGPRAMLEGSAEAQEVINRTNAQSTSVLESIRTILFTAKEMQAAQLEYQKEAAMALRSLVSLRPLPIAPMPREKDVFAVIDPPPM